MTEDLIAWLRVQLDEDERVAGEAERWTNLSDEGWPFDVSDSDRRIALAEAWRDRFTPRQRLAEVAVTRRILDLHQRVDARPDWTGVGSEPACYGCGANFVEEYAEPDANDCPVVRLLALPRATEHGYREEWRPTD